MTRPAIVLALVVTAAASALGGYWLGFRHAWDLGWMADAPVRGVIATQQLHMLEANRTADLRITLEGNVDTGLLWWAQLEKYPLVGSLNILSGRSIIPDYHKYVRRIAVYRQQHPSPLRDPAVVKNMLDTMRAQDPEFAASIEASGREADADMDRMVRKYAP